MLATAWRVIVRRIAADWLILSAAVVTILLAIMLLAAGPIYANGVAVAGARRTLEDAGVTRSNIEVATRSRAAAYQDIDAAVTAELHRLIEPTGGTIVRTASSDPYALPDDVLEQALINDPADDDLSRHLIFRFFEGIEGQATLVEGAWPEDGGEVIQTAIPIETAALLGLSVGDELTVQNRLDRDSAPTLLVAGIYEVNDPDDAYWYGDAMATEGVLRGQSVVSYGPFLVSREVFTRAFMSRPVDIIWRAILDHERFQLAEAATLRRGSAGLAERLEERQPGVAPYSVNTDLPGLLSQIEQSLLAARSSVFILTVQLALLSGYALVLTATLLVDQRRIETALLRARGAGVRQILVLSLMEGALLVVPAILIGPWLAALTLRALNHAGPLAGIGLNLEPEVGPSAYWFAALAGIGCVVTLVVPALFAARSVMGARAARGREGDQPLWQRTGIDLALIVVAGLGFLQLRRFGSPLTETVRGRLEIDPLLVAAPTLGLLAGAIIALRMIPMVAAFVERVVSRGARLVPTLSGWQVSRRSGRYARSALLLMLALGIGLFAVSYTRTWNASQGDQADYQVGADVTVRPNRGNARIDEQYLASAYAQLDGVNSSMPVELSGTNIPTTSGTARVVLLDSEYAPEIVSFRDDLAREPLAALMARLTEGRPALASIPIPGEPRRVGLDLRADYPPLCTEPRLEQDDVGADGVHTYETFECPPHPELNAYEVRAFDDPLSAAAIFRDGHGIFFEIKAGPLAAGGDVERVVFPLEVQLRNGRVVQPSYPVELLAIEFSTIAPPGPGGAAHDAPQPITRATALVVDAIVASDEVSGEAWSTVIDDPSGIEWEINWDSTNSLQNAARFEPAPEQPEGALALSLDAGASGRSFNFSNEEGSFVRVLVQFRMSIEQTLTPHTHVVPVIVNDRLLVEVAFSESDQFTLLLGGGNRRVEIAGSLRSFPSVDPNEPAQVIVDWRTIAALQFLENGQVPRVPNFRWLDIESAGAGAVVNRLEADPFRSNDVLARSERAKTLRADPVALGAIGSLTLGFAAAAIFAAIGFVSSAVVSARERLAEFALLRALGLSPRQLAGWLLLENGFLIAVSLVAGTALGLLLAWLILPLITVTRDAGQVFPDLIVVIPWGTITALEAGVVLLLVAVSGVMALVLRRIGLGSVLRMGEDQ